MTLLTFITCIDTIFGQPFETELPLIHLFQAIGSSNNKHKGIWDMGIVELFILALGLSMDAFAVSICKGLAMEKCTFRNAATCGVWFGGFQALMPLIGYLVGYQFKNYITSIDHWIAFVLLLIIGINMIREAFSKEEKETDNSLSIKSMFVMAIATSIDALAVGVTFAFLPDTNIVAAVLFIGIITFILSTFGAKLGNIFGAKYKNKAEFAGGLILILLGIKILLEHLGVIG